MGRIALSAVWFALPPSAALAAQVKGALELPVVGAASGALGYVRTKVSAPARGATERRASAALFLEVRESLPLSPPAQHPRVRIHGLRLIPDVTACAVDGQVAFVNEEPGPVTLKIDDRQVTIKPGESHTYECVAGERAMRTLRVVEWPHIRGSVFVGEVGVAGLANDDGTFSLTAPQGKYRLRVLVRDGEIDQREIEVGRGDLDLGKIDVSRPREDGKEARP